MSDFNKKLQELRVAHQNIIVVGLEKVAGIVPRRDIDILLKEYPDTFNLLLQALVALQDEKIDDPMSYFQIAGTCYGSISIHY